MSSGWTIGRRTVMAIDALMVIWVAAWIAIGVWVALDVHALGRLADTLGTAASGLGQVSRGIDQLAKLPFVGSAIGKLAADGAATAGSAAANAVTAKRSVDQLAYLLGIVIVVVPAVPALAVYLPFRVNRGRERRAVRRALRTPGAHTSVRRYLAERALANLPYHRLVGISPCPWDDLAQGRVDDLAAAELSRLGFDRRLLDRSGGPTSGGRAAALTGRRTR